MSSSIHPAISETSHSTLAGELRAILTGAAFAPLYDVGWLRIAGPDATRWLNGMVTNAVQALAPGEGCYNFLLNAQGRILGDCTIYRDPTPEPPAFLLETDASQIDAIQAHLDRFIIMDDVELIPVPSNEKTLLLLGPGAGAIVRDHYVGSRGADHSKMLPLRLALDREVPDQISTPGPSLVPRFEIRGIDSRLSEFAASKGAVAVSSSSLEALRILSGTPRYSVDIRNTEKAHDLPQETAQTRALHFAKGCYLGQEIVERIRSRGSVHRTFTGFVLTGELPPAGAELIAGPTFGPEPKRVGELTSVAAIPKAAFRADAPSDAQPLQLALGYIRLDFLETATARGFPLEYSGGYATPAPLPFKLA